MPYRAVVVRMVSGLIKCQVKIREFTVPTYVLRLIYMSCDSVDDLQVYGGKYDLTSCSKSPEDQRHSSFLGTCATLH